MFINQAAKRLTMAHPECIIRYTKGTLMITLGIETATPRLSAALIVDGESPFKGERYTDSPSSHCELITGFISDLVHEAGLPLDRIDTVAVSIGPGSFTGLRIGIATAMGLAYGLGKPVAGIGTLLALAYRITEPGALVCPLIDAKRKEVYSAVYRIAGHDELPKTVFEPSALPVATLADKLNSLGEPVTLTGPAVPLVKNTLATTLELSLKTAPQELHPVSALAVAEIGSFITKAGGTVVPELLKPLYLRRSDAELARDARSSGCAHF
jgi:tRNA threonylcarbamoyladenosine biosynthesis protein TsaB